MPYEIELMSIGDDIYPLLEKSAEALNRLQTEFRFFLTPVNQRQAGIGFRRVEYSTEEIWKFLRTQKEKGGRRPFIIAFVTSPLESPRLRNLFGSHSAGEGLAVVTTFNSAQYVREEARYCRYYLVRYALSFVNPFIKAHGDDERKNCYFHMKKYRPDIRPSMDSGFICDSCREQLENPTGIANRLSDEERDALEKMRLFVSGDFPHAIVMKGGGVKGLAFAGALLELEKHFWFDRHVGTSAGAIAAVLLAASYTPAELIEILRQKDFRDFMDAPGWKIPFNLRGGGLYPGEAFRIWIAELLTKKIPKLAQVPMSELNGALIYAAQWGAGTLPFDSNGARKETLAAFATRCSMSIPFFFQPMTVDGRRVYDGGMRTNFPLKRFIDDYPKEHFIALYLGKADPRSRRWLGSELLDIFLEGEERETVDKHIRDVVVIDTSPIGTVDFRLDSIEKEFLLRIGRAAALRFLFQRGLDEGPPQSQVESAEREAEESRSAVIRLRTHRRQRLIWSFGGIISVIVGMYLVGSLL